MHECIFISLSYVLSDHTFTSLLVNIIVNCPNGSLTPLNSQSAEKKNLVARIRFASNKLPTNCAYIICKFDITYIYSI